MYAKPMEPQFGCPGSTKVAASGKAPTGDSYCLVSEASCPSGRGVALVKAVSRGFICASLAMPYGLMLTCPKPTF